MKIAIIGAGQVGGATGRDIALNAPSSASQATEFSGGEPLFVESIAYFDSNPDRVAEMQDVAREHELACIHCYPDENDFIENLKSADIVIAAVPGNQIQAVTEKYAPYLKRAAIFMQTASVQVPAVRDSEMTLREAGRNDVHAIWAHPGTGAATPGPRATAPGVYKGAAVFVPELKHSSLPDARLAWERAAYIWRIQQTQIEASTPENQDRFFALASGYHHAVVYTLMDMGWDDNGSIYPEYQRAGTILRNTTRVAMSDPKMLVPLLSGHHFTIPRIHQGFEERMQALSRAIEDQNMPELEALLSQARQYRLILAPKDTVPRESIGADIADLRSMNLARGALLPALIGYAEILNAQNEFRHIPFERFPNPSFLDGSASALNDPHRMAELFIAHRDELIPLIEQIQKRLCINVGMIAANDETRLYEWTQVTRERRSEMPPPRRTVEVKKKPDETVESDAVRPEYILNAPDNTGGMSGPLLPDFAPRAAHPVYRA